MEFKELLMGAVTILAMFLFGVLASPNKDDKGGI